MERAVQKISSLLGAHSLPFWSPRYEAHMCTDVSMPALLGYFATMIYNPNNVALEGSAITTVVEMEAGKQLCELFGYNTDENKRTLPLSWGHVTCGGTAFPGQISDAANSLLGLVRKLSIPQPGTLLRHAAARNLKFYPLALKKALSKELKFLATSFDVRACDGTKKAFMDLTTWELLNLKPDTVLDLPDRLYGKYGISPAYLGEVMKKYTIQSTGKDVLEQEYGVDKPPQYMLASTRHYSWPKGGGKLSTVSQPCNWLLTYRSSCPGNRLRQLHLHRRGPRGSR